MKPLPGRILLMIMMLSVVALLLQGCGKTPLFDELAENRLRVVMKGTYESNNPGPWLAIDADGDNLNDENIFDPRFIGDVNLADTAPTKFMFDIAEMRLKEEKFGIERQVYSFPLDDDNDFFNGTGVDFNNDDVPSGFHYSRVNVFIRKMIFDSSTSYEIVNDDDGLASSDEEYFDGEGTLLKGDDHEVIFKERVVKGFDFNLIQKITYYDSLRLEGSSTNRVFPLRVPIYGNFVYDIGNEETVLEVRFVIKNFIKKYEVKKSDDATVLYHYYALSDWLRDVRLGDEFTDVDGNVHGGNLIAIARTYVKGKTVTLAGSGLTAGDYVVAIAGDDDIANYEISTSAVTRPHFEPSSPLDAPHRPYYFVEDDMGARLDYFLQLHRYKLDYDVFVDYIDDLVPGTYDTYTAAWTAYNDDRSAFKIPPLATRVLSDGSFTLTNVPVGYTYKVYNANETVDIMELPTWSSPNTIDETVDVPESAANTIITVPTP